MIDTILWDLDNTIFDFSRAERIALRKTLVELGVEPVETTLNRYSELNDAQWKLLELGKLTRQQVKVRRYQLLFEELGVDASAEQAAKLYEGYLALGHYYMDGAEEVLETLRGQYRMYLVTNGTASVQHGRVNSSNLMNYMEDMFISEEVGYDKPSNAYFDACFARIPDFHKERAVIVGDSLTSDIRGGINAGVRTIWFNLRGIEPSAELSPDREIRKLSELPELLSEL